MVCDYIKRMGLIQFGHPFSGENPIMVFDFLTRFVSKANIQEMSDALALIALSSFLKRFAKSQYEAGVEMVSLEEGGVSRTMPYNIFSGIMRGHRDSVQR